MGHVKLEWEEERYRFSTGICRLDKHTLVTAVVKRGTTGEYERISDIGIIRGRGAYQSEWIAIKGDEEQLEFEASGGVYGVCVLPRMGREEPVKAAVQEALELEWIEEAAVEENVTQVVSPEAVDYATEETLPEPATENTRDMLAEIRKEREALAANKLMENKWDQLCSMYEVVRPVDGDIEFIKIKPEDFVILRQEYQGLVRNSFLLHGYYNYRYILLGKYPDKYYIGVPGIMHEQERMAAAMFGFIGFERADKPSPDRDEDKKNFGYYMMEVAI